jgi:hypothetical protein
MQTHNTAWEAKLLLSKTVETEQGALLLATGKN